MTDPRYPIGKWSPVETLTPEERRRAIDTIAACPAELRRAVAGLDESRLETPYREGGWTVRQVVHHLADSHMNAYVRQKLMVTTDLPTINPYPEEVWAELADARSGDVEVSLSLLQALHDRWVRFLRSLEPAAFARKYRHPAYDKLFTLDGSISLYAWHGRHHSAHITEVTKRNGW